MKPKPNSSVNENVSPVGVRTMAWMGLALLIIISGLSFWSGRRYQQASKWRNHSSVVLAKTCDAQLALAEAESAQRGHLITRQNLFLEDYGAARDRLGESLGHLESLVQDNPEQADMIKSIQPIAKGKFEFLESVVSLVKERKYAAAARLLSEDQGRQLTEAINSYFRSFVRRELELLSQRTAAADRDFSRTSFLILAGLIFSFVLLLFNTIFLQREIAERRVIQNELIKAEARATEASELKSSFLANMSHEIRTPLNGIVGMAKLLESTGLTSEQRDFLDTMKVSSNSLLALINQILDFSKIESGKMQLEEAPFELYSLIQSTVSIVDYAATSKNLRIVTNIAPDVPEFYLGDALRLRQVLLNLLNNAIKFSERGTIQLNVAKKKAWDSRATLAFEIIDEGVGMDEETKRKLFQTFTQGDESTSRKFGGSGLGLAISKQIVEMMDGSIGVESRYEEGSRFYFDVVLKVSKFRTEIRMESSTEMKPRTLGAHLLIAEDNKVNQKVVAEMMKMLGCSLKLVANGRAVLEALRAEKFDLILMDGQMPDMDGYEATRRIRNGEAGEESMRIPIVATTANAIKGDIERCLEAGMNDYIGKPISYDDLAYKVEKWLRRGKQLIDRESIERLVALGKTSGTDLLPGLIALFENESKAALESLAKDLEDQNFEAVAKTAHSLKSSAANLGALRLRDMAERIEKSKADSNARHLAILIEAARTEYAGALRELKENWG